LSYGKNKYSYAWLSPFSLHICNLDAKKLNKMKNVFAIFFFAGMFVFASCDNAGTTTEDTTTTEVTTEDMDHAGHDHDAMLDDTTAVAADTAVHVH
jgi:hypothetical protein